MSALRSGAPGARSVVGASTVYQAGDKCPRALCAGSSRPPIFAAQRIYAGERVVARWSPKPAAVGSTPTACAMSDGPL